VDSRSARQRIDCQAGVVGYRWQTGFEGRVTSLQQRVLDESCAGFFRRVNAEVALRDNLDPRACQERLNLA
jgi:hypothetical protein